MSFKNIIGHEKTIAYFKSVIKNKKIAHAILLDGIDGIGKNLIASSAAQAIFCETASGDACGTCRQCIKMSHDNHPDYLMIEPDGKQIKNNQIEAFQEFLNTKPYEAMRKVVLIKDVEKMNVSSQNRILKTLEEPPEDVVIFMTSSNGEKLLPTVLSRVQLIKLHGLKESSITTFLVNTYETEDDTAKFASKMSGGSLKQAIDFVTNEEFKKAQEEVYELMVALTKKDKPSVLGSMSFFNSDKEQINSRLDYMLLWYRDLLLFKKSKVKEVLVHIQSLDFIKKAARQYSVKRLIENIEVIEQTKQKLNQHGNFDLTIEYMLVKLLEE